MPLVAAAAPIVVAAGEKAKDAHANFKELGGLDGLGDLVGSKVKEGREELHRKIPALDALPLAKEALDSKVKQGREEIQIENMIPPLSHAGREIVGRDDLDLDLAALEAIEVDS